MMKSVMKEVIVMTLSQNVVVILRFVLVDSLNVDHA